MIHWKIQNLIELYNFRWLAVRATPAVFKLISILFLYLYYLTTFYLFFYTNSPPVLSISLSTLFKYIFYSFISFKYYIFYSFFFYLPPTIPVYPTAHSHPPPPPPPPWINPEQPKPTVTTTVNQLLTTTNPTKTQTHQRKDPNPPVVSLGKDPNPPPQADLGSANPTTTPSHRIIHPRPRQRPKPTAAQATESPPRR